MRLKLLSLSVRGILTSKTVFFSQASEYFLKKVIFIDIVVESEHGSFKTM